MAASLNRALVGLASLLLFFSAVMILFRVPGWWGVPIVLAGLAFAVALSRPIGGLWQRLHQFVSFVAIALMLGFVFLFIYFLFAVVLGGD